MDDGWMSLDWGGGKRERGERMGGMGEGEKGDGRETSDARRETRDERDERWLADWPMANGEWRMAGKARH
jgi:hypothetical protein